MVIEGELAQGTEPVALTIEGVQKLIPGVSRSLIRHWVREGSLPAVRVGKSRTRILILVSDLMKMLREKRKVKP